PVRQYKNRQFNSLQKLFYHHFTSGMAELSSEHLFKFSQGLLMGFTNKHSLTSGQSIRFQHNRKTVLPYILLAFFKRRSIKFLVSCCRNMMFFHKGLGKGFASLQLSPGSSRTNHRKMA